MNWNKLAKNIPAEVKIGSRVKYEVLYIKEFSIKEDIAKCDYGKKQLIIKEALGPKLKVESFLHECLHAFSYQHNIGLTEQQILDFESAFPYLITIIKELNK